MNKRTLGFVSLSLLAACGGGSRHAMTGGAASPAYAKEYAPQAEAPPPSTEHYTDYGVNPFVDTTKDRFSTFAIDVDTASWSISRRKLRENIVPPKSAVRVEEFVNSFDYGYAPPEGNAPFAVHLAGAPSPFEQGHHLVRVAIKGKQVQGVERKPVHLVYLVDTSGSMHSEDKIGLAKKSLHLLTDTLHQGDTIALCTYAGWVREVLPPTGVEHKGLIHGAIDDLSAEGSTAMSDGLELAYKLAKKTAVKGHVNRVIVLSDGDANVGASSHEEILKRIGQYKTEGITLSTVGFGNGNYQDTMMEQLADKGDGNYSYIDDEKQAKKVFVDQIDGLLQVIARDVKVQVEFDPEAVAQYRLLGYENRDVADKDFKNDKVDGGEIGAGHSVTAIYDVVLKPQPKPQSSPKMLTVRIRHKAPFASGGADAATENAWTLGAPALSKTFDIAPASFRFAIGVAAFAEILRESPYAKEWTFGSVESIAKGATIASVPGSERAELLELIGRAKALLHKS